MGNSNKNDKSGVENAPKQADQDGVSDTSKPGVSINPKQRDQAKPGVSINPKSGQ